MDSEMLNRKDIRIAKHGKTSGGTCFTHSSLDSLNDSYTDLNSRYSETQDYLKIKFIEVCGKKFLSLI